MSRENKVIGVGLMVMALVGGGMTWRGVLEERAREVASVQGWVVTQATVTSCRDHTAYITETSSKRTTTRAEDQAYYGYSYEVAGTTYTGGDMLRDASCPEVLGRVQVHHSPDKPAGAKMVEAHEARLHQRLKDGLCMSVCMVFLFGIGAMFLFGAKLMDEP